MAELYSTVLSLSNPPFSEIKWTTNGGAQEHEGLYLIVDGGYLGWSTLMAPNEEETRDLLTGAWSEHLESIWKDVEWTFGILKKHFGLLCAPLLVRTQDKVEDIVWTACWLHNVMLSYDYDDDDDAFLQGFGDEGDLDDKDYHDVILDEMMHAVLQEWCDEDGMMIMMVMARQ